MILYKKGKNPLNGEDKNTLQAAFSISEIQNNLESPQISSHHVEMSNRLAQDIDVSGSMLIPQNISRNPWKLGGLRIIFYITKFIKQMKNSSTQINFKFLTKEMVQLINDQASDPNLLLKTQQNPWLKNFKIIVNQIPIIEPESLFKIFWDTFVLIQILINVFYIPMKLGFGLSNGSRMSEIFLEYIPLWTFFTEIILNFMTAYYKKGQIHRDIYGIFRHYIKSQFWLDLIIVVPFFLSFFDLPFVEYILLFRITRVKQMISNIEEIINPSQSIQAIISLIKSVFFILFVIHFCACLWTFLGEIQQQSGNSSWLEVKQIQDADWTSKYIHSLYFSTITTLTVGYGDIVPTTDVERVFAILMALVICGVFGYTISSIGEILKQLSLNRYKFKQQMMILNNYLKKKKLSKQLQLQVRKYFEYFFKMQQNQEDDERMLQQLPKELKEQVAIDLYYAMLMKSRLIKAFSNESVLKLCKYVSEQKFAPDHLVAQQNSPAQFLYFVQSGEIQLTCQYNLQETILRTIGSQNFIGEREFIIQSQYDYSIKTSKFTQLAYIDYEDFLKVVREDVAVDEKFCMMRDSLKFNVEKQNYGQICPICSWTHQYSECPMIFLKVNKQKIIRKSLMNVLQLRKMIIRRQQFKSRINYQEIQQDAIEYIINNEIISNKELNSNTLEKYGFTVDKQTIQSQKSIFNSEVKDDSIKSLQKDESIKSLQKDESIKSLQKYESIKSLKFQKQRTGMQKKKSRILLRNDTMYAKIEEPDAQSMRMQNSVLQKISKKVVSNKNSQNTIPPLQDRNKQSQDTSTLKGKSVLFQQEQVIEGLKLKLDSTNNIPEESENFEIDKQFLAGYYFVNDNYDFIIRKLSENIVQEKHQFDMSRLRRKKKRI